MKTQRRLFSTRTPAISFDLIEHTHHASLLEKAGTSSLTSLLSSQPTSATSSQFPTRTSSGTDGAGDYYGIPVTPPQRPINLPDIFVFTPSDDDPGQAPNYYCAFRASEQQPSPPTPDLAKLNEALEFLERMTEDLPTFGRLPGVALDKMVVLPKRRLSVDMPAPGQALFESEVAVAAALLESSYRSQSKAKTKVGVAQAIKNAFKVKLRTRQADRASTAEGSKGQHFYHYTRRSEYDSSSQQGFTPFAKERSPKSRSIPPKHSTQPLHSSFDFNVADAIPHSPYDYLSGLPLTSNSNFPRRRKDSGIKKLFRQTKGGALWAGGTSNPAARQSTPHLPSRSTWESDLLSSPPLPSNSGFPSQLSSQPSRGQSVKSLPLQGARVDTWTYPSNVDIPPIPPRFESNREVPPCPTAHPKPLPPIPPPLQPAFELREKPQRRLASYRKPVPRIEPLPSHEGYPERSSHSPGPVTSSNCPASGSPFSTPLSSLRRSLQSVSPTSDSQNESPLSPNVNSPRSLLARLSLASSKKTSIHLSEASSTLGPSVLEKEDPKEDIQTPESRRRLMQLDSLHFSDLDFDILTF
ncbi:hypothetical protein FRB90_011558 [Tulasnella sp. 427]|nr:hypothetical protein FRB90_011558 [Tulasnella sp. 427]